MTARDLNEIGLHCPACQSRLVSMGSREYRCTNDACAHLYEFSIDAEKGIVLTLMEERLQSQRKDALPSPEQPTEGRPAPTPRLLLIDSPSFREEYMHEARHDAGEDRS